MTLFKHAVASLIGIAMASVALCETAKKITVDAGKSDRIQTILSFKLPAGATGPLQLRGGTAPIPLQVNGDQAWFILDSLKAGTTMTYTIEPGTPDAAVRIQKDGTNLTMVDVKVFEDKANHPVRKEYHEILRYNGDKTPLPAGIEPVFQRGGYIHPVYTPSGKLLTDDYAPDHKHHHGIWSPWTKTEYEGRHPDFWNMGAKTGRVDFDKLGETFSGPVASGFATHHNFIDMTATPEKTALTEVWDVTVYRPTPPSPGKKPYYIFDITTTQNVTDSPLTLPKYHYGGMGFRGRREWKGTEGALFLTSEGKDRKTGNETRARWCWCGGLAEDGSTIGLTIMDHPGNFRSPQPMRLNPDQPFFCYAPSQLGDWKIEKGTPYVARYRFIAADGAADVDEINRLWEDYANPPKVTVE